ncbi:TetR family transcriptional regulator [Flammeovirga yaeyamensis]|uniref:TetR family transcriptional regulator n=1 Tax=Flammeovirga yaeyamensis TaxID=367791 RepID=A0AAX1NBD5_9BACT|nr:TetR/AcrR family transcriptional regulator [Flammeovirga yaeyamensis]MBB3699301.1 AcrR family transcriptional regulator [Flammeovirga yaeyamensis]NMF35436.1 TetR/AcrR family transcriptional regulator [Flammeovirga yaeyamensis]QWG04296.1 TetR family transcriptional regulator [Flammeovirga yaeyamensis]
MKAKDKIIQSATTLFLDKGIKKVNITDIIEDAGVSKMSFYRQFKNKEDILLAVLKQFFMASMDDYQKILDKKLSFLDFLNEIILMKIEVSKKMSKSFMEELMSMFHEKNEILDFLMEHQKKSTALFIEQLMQAKSNGEVGDDFSIEFLMYMMEKTQQVASDPMLLQMFDTPEEAVKQATKFYFFGIYGQRK